MGGARAPVWAQRLGIWVDAGAAHAGTPAGVAGAEATTYGLVGGRAYYERGPGLLDAVLHAGHGAGTEGGAWLSGAFGAEATAPVGRGRIGGRAEAFGLDYREPFAYAAVGATLAPRLTIPVGVAELAVRAELSRGRWSSEPAPDPTATTATTSITGPLAVTGAAVALGLPLGPTWLEATGEAYEARNDAADGGYGGLGAAVSLGTGRLGAELGGRVWATPTGREVGYRIGVHAALDGGLVAQLSLGRGVSDPLYGTPAAFAASVGLSWRLATLAARPAAPVARVTGPVGDGRHRVRFTLDADAAERVAIAGDFTGWEPQPMHRAGEEWRIEIALEPGVHHFGFVLDGERWFVPEHAPGVADDGWGRRNASIVVTPP